jgi:N-acetylglutamate synthase-like GNAT family acetyltransferase
MPQTTATAFFQLFGFTKIKATVVPALCWRVDGRQYGELWATYSSKTQAEGGLK